MVTWLQIPSERFGGEPPYYANFSQMLLCII